jgi:hypothetical protein
MPGQRDDYVLRLIDELRQFVAQLMKLNNASRLDEALMAAVSAQEKLFARPAADFMARPVDEQIRILKTGESEDTGRTKCLAYAAILEEAGLVYRAKSQEDFANGAFEMALYVMLSVALESPEGPGLHADVARLLGRVGPDKLHAIVSNMLDRFIAAG